MIKSVLKKLSGQRGESIAETLIALLISALALTMLAGAIGTAADLIQRSETRMAAYYEGLNALGSPSTAGVTVTLSDGANPVKLKGGDEAAVPVKYAVNAGFTSKPVMAYAKSEE